MNVKINYRFPWEFYGIWNNSWKQAFKIWAFHKWYEEFTSVYIIAGVRFLGIEISKKNYM